MELTKEVKQKTSMHVQALILDYLGVFNTINKQKAVLKKSEFLSILIDKNSKNIRDHYKELTLKSSSKQGERNKIKKHLLAVKKAFESLKSEEIIKKIDNDIAALDKLDKKL